MNKKNIIKIIITIVLLIGIIGTSYAYFVYSKYSGYNNELITGDIWMHYKESSVNINSDLEYNFSDYVHLNSLYALNTEDDNVEKCVNYLHETYGDTWNGMTYENNGSSGFGGFEPEPSSNKNLTITPKFIDNVTVTGGSPSYYEYCSNDYESGGSGGEPAKNTPSLYNYTVKKLASYGSYDYYNLIINDYLNGVMSSVDKKFFEENEIIVNNTSMLLDSLSELPYYEFIIDGKNTYKQKDIWYEIDLLHGDNHPTRTERAKDEFLKFSLVEIENNNVSILFKERTYDDLTNKRVWVDTISSNDGEVHRVYRLYMSFIHEIKVGSASENNDYDFDTWNNEVYASVKVKVSGDFAEKNVEYNDVPGESIETDPSCFGFDTISVYQRNKNMTSEELNTCTNYMVNNDLVPDEYTLNSNLTESQINTCATYLLDTWNDGENESFEAYELNTNMTSEELQACVDYVNNDLGFDWNTGETAEAFCNGTGTNWGDTFQKYLDINWFSSEQLTYFQEHNIISSVTKSIKGEYKNFCSGTGKLETDDGTYTFQEMLNKSLSGGSLGPLVPSGPGPMSYSLDKNKNKKYSINSIKNDLKSIALYIDYTSFTSSDLNFFEENNIISNSVNKQQVARDFCEGTGKISGNNFDGWIDDFSDDEIEDLVNENIILQNTYNAIDSYDSSCGSDVVIPSSYPVINYTLNTNMTNEELQACVDYLNNDLRWGWNTGETASSFCRGTGTYYGDTFQEILDNNWFDQEYLNYFQEHNIISAETTTDMPITAINSYAFSGSILTSVVIPSTIKYIGKNAFTYTNILSVDVPSSVESSVCGVFDMDVVINTSTPLVCRYEFSNSGYSSSPVVG